MGPVQVLWNGDGVSPEQTDTRENITFCRTMLVGGNKTVAYFRMLPMLIEHFQM